MKTSPWAGRTEPSNRSSSYGWNVFSNSLENMENTLPYQYCTNCNALGTLILDYMDYTRRQVGVFTPSPPKSFQRPSSREVTIKKKGQKNGSYHFCYICVSRVVCFLKFPKALENMERAPLPVMCPWCIDPGLYKTAR